MNDVFDAWKGVRNQRNFMKVKCHDLAKTFRKWMIKFSCNGKLKLCWNHVIWPCIMLLIYGNKKGKKESKQAIILDLAET